MIRILHVVGIMNMGGIENFLMNIYREIDRDQVQFDFLVTRKEQGFFDDEIRKMGGNVINISALEDVGIRRHRLEFDNILKQNSCYRIVHCHRDALCDLYLKVAKNNGVPIRIAHSHSSKIAESKNIKGYLKKIIKNYQIKKAASNATVCLACSSLAGHWLFGDKDFIIVNNGIDIKKYQFDDTERKIMRNSLGVGNDNFVIGHVGSFNIAKNHTFIINLFVKFLEINPNAILLLIGDGTIRKDIIEMVKKANVANNVHFLGIRDDVSDILQAIDVFVLPSLYEGFPVALIEAQASGVPCLVSEDVAKEVDLGIAYLEFLPIADETPWVDALKKIETLYENEKITRAVESNRIDDFSVKEVLVQLMQVYQVT